MRIRKLFTTILVTTTAAWGQATATPPMQPHRVKISGGAVAGLSLYKVDPIYPEEAKQKGISGSVVLPAVIGEDGAIEELAVVSGSQYLALRRSLQ